ncbi:hypothetical protein [Streptomyces sp. NPDC046821]|uniref:hypothetical protein n=1 Tax=Streptomyces sp. NPDC046821 TaxID=3154702 RepID=UPI0033D57CA8
MASAPQVHTAELSDAELDNVSGGLSPHGGLTAGPVSISDADVRAQVGAAQNEAIGALGQFHQAGVSVSY